MNRVKTFVKKNKKPLTQIAGVVAVELVGIATYILVCDHYGYKMVAPHQNEDGLWIFRDVSGRRYHFAEGK